MPQILNLGAIESPKDKRDVQLGMVQAPVIIPPVKKPAVEFVPKYYQGRQPACGGHAGAFFKSYLDWLSLNLPVARSPRMAYACCKKDDGYAGDGTYLRQIFLSLKNYGLCDAALYPNAIDLPTSIYADYKQISLAAWNDAGKNKLGPFAWVTDLSFYGLQKAIYQNQAVILLIKCDDGFFGTTTPTFTQKKYGHFVVGVGYDQGGIYIVDSTEQDERFAVKYIPSYAVDLGFVLEAGTAVDIPNWLLIGLTSKSDVIRFITQRLAYLYQQLKVAPTS